MLWVNLFFCRFSVSNNCEIEKEYRNNSIVNFTNIESRSSKTLIHDELLVFSFTALSFYCIDTFLKRSDDYFAAWSWFIYSKQKNRIIITTCAWLHCELIYCKKNYQIACYLMCYFSENINVNERIERIYHFIND